MVRRINFTRSILENIQLPTSGRITLHDEVFPGLQCRITSSGIKTFCVFRRIKGGNPERVTLGKFPMMTISEARTKAAGIISSMVQGISSAEILRAKRSELTFEELFNDFLEKHSKVRKATWKSDERNYRKHLQKPLGRKKISQITRSDLAIIHADLTSQIKGYTSDGKPQYKKGSTSNRILALASAIFNWGISRGRCEVNPARGIKKFSEKSRDRFLQAEEMPIFFEAVMADENPDIKDCVMLFLFTGARRRKVAAMRWEEISFERMEWRIPQTKNGEPLTLPLTDEAIAILKARVNNGSEYVFPSKKGSAHFIYPEAGWKRILKRSGLEDLRMHDLRRTFASWQVKNNSSLTIVGKSLGHKSPQSTSVYARVDINPVRESVKTATTAILAAAYREKKEIVMTSLSAECTATFQISNPVSMTDLTINIIGIKS